MIETLKGKRVIDVTCGDSHSAAVTSSGELYTWGLGSYGRLGHGDIKTYHKPKLVSVFLTDQLTCCLLEDIMSASCWSEIVKYEIQSDPDLSHKTLSFENPYLVNPYLVNRSLTVLNINNSLPAGRSI